MVRSFEITISTIAYAFKDVMITTVLYLAVLFWFGRDLHPDENSVFILGVGLSLIFYLGMVPIPALVLFFNYLSKGSTRKLVVNNQNFMVNDKTVNFSDISKVKIFGTYQHFNPPVGAATLPYNDYFYYLKVFTISGQEIVLTSLLGYEIDKELRKVLPSETFVQEIKAFPTV